jgi:hypothetical protein
LSCTPPSNTTFNGRKTRKPQLSKNLEKSAWWSQLDALSWSTQVPLPLELSLLL